MHCEPRWSSIHLAVSTPSPIFTFPFETGDTRLFRGIKTKSMKHTLVLLALLLSCLASPLTAADLLALSQPMPERHVVVLGGTNAPSQPVIRVEDMLQKGRVSFLGWDTEGGDRSKLNLLRSGISLFARSRTGMVDLACQGSRPGSDTVLLRLAGAEVEFTWTIRAAKGGMTMKFNGRGPGLSRLEALELVFPFEVKTAVTSMISSRWDPDGKFRLPAIMSAPDLGQMLVRAADGQALAGRVEGSRAGKSLAVTFELPVPRPRSAIELKFSPVVLPAPDGYGDEKRWAAARRGWFDLIQQSCGASGGGVNVHGVWANNALSDPVSSVLYMLGDATILAPKLADGVSMAPILRRAVDYWIDCNTDPDGLVAYTAGGRGQNVMDSNPAVLIGAWCYVKV